MNKLSLRNLMKERKKKGFTLVELIIVIAIIAILVAIAVPRFGQVTRNANIRADIATAKNIHGIAAQLVAEGEEVDDDAVAGRIDGADGMPNTRLNRDRTFHVAIDAGTGDITVTDGTDQIYPNGQGAYAQN